MKIYEKKPSKGFIHFLINFGLIIFIFGAILYKSWLWVGLATVIYLLYIWNNIGGFAKKGILGLFIRSKPLLRLLRFLKNPSMDNSSFAYCDDFSIMGYISENRARLYLQRRT